MASGAQVKGILKQNQKTSTTADERFQSYQSSSRQDKVKKSRNRDTSDEIEIQLNALERNRRERVTGSSKCDDELVRYMSKLPGYLQREKRGESFKGKALNVGVLDWGRLEKWKHGQKGDQAATDANHASFSGINISEKVQRKKSHRYKTGEQLSTRSILDSSSKDDISRDLQHSVGKSRRSRESELVSGDSLNKQKKAVCSHESSSRDRAQVDPGKSRRRHSSQKLASGLLSDMGNSGSSIGAKESTVAYKGDTQRKAERKHVAEVNQKAPDPVIVANTGATSVRSRKNSISSNSGENQSFKKNGAKKIAEEFQDVEAGLAFRQQRNEHGNIVHSRHKKHTSSAIAGETQISLDDNLGEANQGDFSTDYASGSDHRSSKWRSQIPHSYPLSLDFAKDSGSSILPPGAGLSGTSGRLDQESFEEGSGKSRQASPSRKFSFSFSRISRSFSFKEGSAAQPLSSDDGIKSGPVRLEASTCPDGSINPEKLNNHNRARASPLKRLLDPLLKPKGTGNIPSLKARITSSNLKPINSDEPLQDGRIQDMSTTRALVQLTIRNGLTLFRFMVDDNSSSILVATMKTSALSTRDSSVQYCTFYSVNEVKKKSGSWLIHGNKDKQCGFVYNTVGQMRLSNSLTSDLTGQSFRNHCPVREAVLFEFELKHSDQETKKIKAGTELAAVVINRPSQNSTSKAPKNSTTENPLEENRDASGTTTIILPGGVHSFPDKGAPSPLIDRWRSGGSCDCGGWDIGCKLRVLSNQRCFHGFPFASKAQSASFQLFDQEGTQQNAPAFTLALLKTGIYSVEFSANISPLQAFFVCVTVITCDYEQRYDDPKFSTCSEPRAPEDTVSEAEDQTKSRQMPVRFSPFNPPLSPVGRV